jgi:hypothetical protein
MPSYSSIFLSLYLSLFLKASEIKTPTGLQWGSYHVGPRMKEVRVPAVSNGLFALVEDEDEAVEGVPF